VIITFRLSATEFKAGIAHRQGCHLCDDLAHLYLEVAELAKVRLVINDLDDRPDNGNLVGQLNRLHAQFRRRRRTGLVHHARGHRSPHNAPRDEQERALKVIRQAWDTQEGQELCGSYGRGNARSQ
jgi:hypothetical protein